MKVLQVTGQVKKKISQQMFSCFSLTSFVLILGMSHYGCECDQGKI